MRAFSLIELVIVIIIMGAVTAIAIPRLSRGAQGADVAALYADMEVLNKAIDMYRFEHRSYPAPANIAKQLTKYSNRAGTQFAASPDAANGIILGPYVLRIPPVPAGPNQGAAKIGTAPGDGVGWIYDLAHVRIIPNLADGSGTVPDKVFEALGIDGEARGDFVPSLGGGVLTP